MTIANPIHVQPSGLTTGQELGFRPFQRITAEVLSVSGVQAVLSVDGFPMVARLTSAQQAVELASQRYAQFLVVEMGGRSATLRMLKPETQEPAAEALAVPLRNLAARLLEQQGLSPTVQNLILARAALNQRLPLTQETLDELKNVLSQVDVPQSLFDGWGQEEANLAAGLKAAGLPLSAGSLELARQQTNPVGQALADLVRTLQQFAGRPAALPELDFLIRNNQRLLEEAVLNLRDPAGQMAGRLMLYNRLFGRSFENILRDHLQMAKPLSPEDSLVSLARLYSFLKQSGEKELSGKIAHFLDDVRQSLFFNIRANPSPGAGDWAEINLLLKNPTLNPLARELAGRIRIARRSSSGKGIDPAYTRITVQVDVEKDKTFEVDLSLAGKKIHAMVNAPDPQLSESARLEFPTLQERINNLGYSFRGIQVGVGRPQPIKKFSLCTDKTGSLMAVDIEV